MLAAKIQRQQAPGHALPSCRDCISAMDVRYYPFCNLFNKKENSICRFFYQIKNNFKNSLYENFFVFD